jgi:phage FluMu protein Com
MTKINCEHCGRYLFTACGNCLIQEMPCPGCKATNNFNIRFAVPVKQEGFKFTNEKREPKKLKQKLELVPS